jgi:hypothetical protein
MRLKEHNDKRQQAYGHFHGWKIDIDFKNGE